MKTPNLKMLLVLLAGVVIVSCIHEFSEENKPPEMNLTVQEARAAFEREADILEISPLTTSVNTRSLDDGIVITPLWDKAVNFSDTNGAYVVVPFNLPLGHIFARKQFDMEVPDDEKFNNTDIRLLIEKKQKNEYLYSVIYLTGNYSFIREDNGDIASLRLDNLKTFSGSIRCYSLQGKMLWGNIYHHGRIVGSISTIDEPSQAELDSLKNNNSTTVQTRVYVTRCEPHLIEYEVCYHTGYPTAEGIVETHVECHIEHHWENYCYDVWIEDGTDNYRCPFCGNPNCGGYCQPTPPNPDGGGGVSIDRSSKELMDKLKFVPFNGGNCLTLAKSVLQKYGLTSFGSSENVFKLVYESDNVLKNWGNNPAENYTNAIACIDVHLNANRPIIVGVDYDLGRSDNEGTTDHFVVITGRGYDTEMRQYYYTFMDCGTTKVDMGCDTNINRFYYDNNSYNLSGTTAYSNGRYYTVTQVRPNDGRKYNTTNQYGN